MEDGEIEVDSIEPMGLLEITPAMARESGFRGLVDLLKVAKHAKGENVYLIRFRYIGARAVLEKIGIERRRCLRLGSFGGEGTTFKGPTEPRRPVFEGTRFI
jgi:hypothetical protein